MRGAFLLCGVLTCANIWATLGTPTSVSGAKVDPMTTPDALLKDTAHKGCKPGEPCKVIPVPVHSCPGPCECEEGAEYLRVSAVMGRDELMSPELQAHENETFSTRKKIKIVKVVCDINKSGASFTKRRVDELINDIKAGQYTQVVMRTWDRWGRDEPESQIYLRRVKEAGGRVHASAEDFDTDTDVGELTVGQLLLIAQFRRRGISKGWREVGAKRLRDGLPHTGKQMWGYTYNRADGYKIDPTTGPALKEAYEALIAGGSLIGIATQWNAQGLRTLKGVRITRQAVSRIMDTGFAAGYIRRKSNPRKSTDTGGNKRRDYDVWADGVQPRIITREQWEQYTAIRDRTAEMPARLRRAAHALSGLLYCQLCADHPEDPKEVRLVSGYYSKDRKHMWVCRRSRDDRGIHRHVTISNSRAMAQVLAWVEAQVGSVDVSAEVKRLATVAAAGVSAAQFEVEIARLVKRRKNINSRLTDAEGTDREDLEEQLGQVKAELTAAEVGLESARAVEAGQGIDRVRTFTTLMEEWNNFEPHAQRELIAALVRKIMVLPPEAKGGQATLVPVEVWS